MATTRVEADQGFEQAPRRQRRLRRPAGFGLVLLAIVVSMIVIATIGDLPIGRFLAVGVIAAALLLALRAAEVPPRHHIQATVLTAVAVVGAFLALITGRGTPGFTGGIMLLLVVLTPVVLATRLVRNPDVTAQSLIGALCVYLLIGIAFELVYGIAAELTGVPFFVQTNRPTSADYQYYSFITLTTVGYGDLSPRETLGRMMAITEALAGQVYLVTVVALMVSNYRRRPD
jgi:Ion channel